MQKRNAAVLPVMLLTLAVVLSCIAIPLQPGNIQMGIVWIILGLGAIAIILGIVELVKWFCSPL